MLREIAKAVEALKAVPREYHTLVLAEAAGNKAKKPGPAKGWKTKPKPEAAPVVKKSHHAAHPAPVKVSKEKLAKLAKLAKIKGKPAPKGKPEARVASAGVTRRPAASTPGLDEPVSLS